ncbi:MAG: FKBP-type peptidyl-prolyl cis-trans isomerase [Sphingobacteriales bacterium]|jgi:FKBP-type peptidyl-prolyl cis-trans isomerase SlyD|nr:FKBP-type peptidyl-prolyl cis-trans isomerase [Sphingobacteriales bacterium]MBP9140248.1 FKBP-type peptidyl-prolyl cis-trans isomerase [Chitinophagales bacterium]MDA0197618.1 FKBP-type peptidyl-prolyl cis-trans isomerase [Bacteroidota bacterium]MBK6889023.1 FKBP-type peptidyl-prolyl cis-trans isomerase [Sphingobacteriales bacterium]MBK7528473.1 FKBP-type peptidyl-prolyl cis-trans isomerase [Sphingobacteriales bacterium]
MEISPNTVVAISYNLFEGGPEGTFIEATSPDQPFVFLCGAGNVLDVFEDNLTGLRVGDSFEFIIDSNNAYGPVDEQAVVGVPIESFIIDGALATDLLKIGNIIPMVDENNHKLNARIIDITEQIVTLDFNHPMAGRDLFFTGSVVAVRAATATELSHGHVHGFDGTDEHGGHHH